MRTILLKTKERMIEVYSKEGEVIEHLPIVREDKIKRPMKAFFVVYY